MIAGLQAISELYHLDLLLFFDLSAPNFDHFANTLRLHHLYKLQMFYLQINCLGLTIDSAKYLLIPIGGSSDFYKFKKFLSHQKPLYFRDQRLPKVTSLVFALNLPKTAVTNIPLNFAATNSLLTP